MSLNENSKFKIKIPSGTPKVDKLIISDIDEWSLYNIWSVRQPLYLIEDSTHNDGIVLTMKQIKKLEPILSQIIKQNKQQMVKSVDRSESL